MQIPAIKSVEIEKNGRFWAVKTDGDMLCIALYKRGALAVQQLVCGLSGLPKPETKQPSKPKKASSAPSTPSSGGTATKRRASNRSKPKNSKAKTKKRRSSKSTKKS